MPVTFNQPLFLLLILLIIPAAVLATRWFATMSRARAWSAIILRAVLLALLSAILAGAASIRSRDRVAVIAVVDASQSVRQLADEFTDFGADASGKRRRWAESVRTWLETASLGRKPDDLMGLVVFDGTSVAVAAPASGPIADYSLDWSITEGTDIAQALRLADAMFPPGAARRLVLISDGAETAGSAADAAERLAANATGATRVDVVPLAYEVRNEVSIDSVDVPPLAASNSRIAVRVALRATNATSGTLNLRYEGQVLDINGDAPGDGLPVDLVPGINPVTVEIDLLPDNTLHRLEPVFTPAAESGDRMIANNTARAFTVTPSKGSVAVVDGWNLGERSPLVRTLIANGVDARALFPSELPLDLLQLSNYNCIILDNVPSEDLPRHAHRVLADYVETFGGGLIMVGGKDSLTAGGWKGTDIEHILPVSLDLPDDVIMPSAAVCFIIDASGSMGAPVSGTNKTQQQVANEATAQAIAALDKNDLVEVIAFDTFYKVMVPLQRNTNPSKTASIVRGISPGGGTDMYPPLKQAASDLINADASVKHVILLSDGQSQGSPSDGINTAARLAAADITVSTIAVGDGADINTLSAIAAQGGGKFYHVVDPTMLPRILIKEVRVVRKPEVRESPFIPIDLRSGSPVVEGISRPFLPLGGLVLTQPKPDPKIQNVLATPEGEPVLAHWNFGRGQAAVFTSDAHNWAAEWIAADAWGGYAKMWTQLVRRLSRPPVDADYQLETRVAGDELIVRLDVFNDQGAPVDSLTVPGTVYGPDNSTVDVTLEQVAPGVYEARAPAMNQGSYVVALAPREGATLKSSVIGGATRQVGPEFRRLSSNIETLQRVAEITGGRLLNIRDPQSALLFDRTDLAPVRASSPLWPWLLAWSVVFFILDVATRRVAWDRLVNRHMAAEFADHAAGAIKARGEGAVRTVGKLKARADRTAGAASPGTARPSTDSASPVSQAGPRRADPTKPDAPPVPNPQSEIPDSKSDDSPASSLLAAKRRARARIEGDSNLPKPDQEA